MKVWNEPKARLIAPAIGPCHNPGTCKDGGTPYAFCQEGTSPFQPW